MFSLQQRFFMVFVLSIFSASIAMAEMKLGYIDVQKAIQTTSTGQKAKQELETEFNKKKAELEKRESELRKKGEDLKRKESVLSAEVMQKKQGELQQEIMQFRETMGKSQMDIQKKQNDLTQPIVEKIKKAIEKVAADGSYSMILEKTEQSVIWAKSELDITDLVVKEYEKMK